MIQDSDHQDPKWDERINAPELGSIEVRILTFAGHTCFSLSNWETGELIYHRDVAHDKHLGAVRHEFWQEITHGLD